MKKLLKFLLIFTSVAGALLLCALIYALCVTSGYSLNKEKLIDTDYAMEFYDINGDAISVYSGKNLISEEKNIPKYVKDAFIAVEDKRFYSHKGIDGKALARAAFNNLKTFSFKEGASTISQQLIKNTHLSNEKTIKRKLIEWKLTKQLEREFTKDEILEMYLNTIYFGKNSYGITAAAQNYFDKNVDRLSLSEAAALAGIVKAPSAYSPAENAEKCISRRNVVLKLMLEQKLIGAEEYAAAVKERLALAEPQKSECAFYLEKAREELENLLSITPYSVKKCKVYTFYDPNAQALLCENAQNEYGKFTGIILDHKTGGVRAYYSENNDEKRQAGSVLKPLAVYAPAIENRYVSECTLLLDEKTDFGGYCPSNYGDRYDGYISVKESLERSSNVCAVKLLNAIGAKAAREFLTRLGIETQPQDENLSLALGASAYGFTLKDICAAYTAFSGYGTMQKPVFIRKIETQGTLKYQYNPDKKQVMSEEGACMMNYMLKGVCENGTAKKLSALDMEIAAKTGTVGGKNGNTDAYCISYSPEYTVGIRYSSGENLMPNNVTGGGLPATKSYAIWKNLKTDKNKKFATSENIVKCRLDKISYETDHLLILADERAPEKYIAEGYFFKNNLPKETSSRFSSPKLENAELSVNKNEIKIELCQTEYYDFIVYCEVDGVKSILFDSGKTADKRYELKDTMTQDGKIYSYSVVPYFKGKSENIYGEEIFLGKARCRINIDLPDEWWDFE